MPVMQVLPWSFYAEDSQEVRFWIHYGLVILGFLLAAITFIVQWIKPAPYGKLETKVWHVYNSFNTG